MTYRMIEVCQFQRTFFDRSLRCRELLLRNHLFLFKFSWYIFQAKADPTFQRVLDLGSVLATENISGPVETSYWVGIKRWDWLGTKKMNESSHHIFVSKYVKILTSSSWIIMSWCSFEDRFCGKTSEKVKWELMQVWDSTLYRPGWLRLCQA